MMVHLGTTNAYEEAKSSGGVIYFLNHALTTGTRITFKCSASEIAELKAILVDYSAFREE